KAAPLDQRHAHGLEIVHARRKSVRSPRRLRRSLRRHLFDAESCEVAGPGLRRQKRDVARAAAPEMELISSRALETKRIHSSRGPGTLSTWHATSQGRRWATERLSLTEGGLVRLA